MVLREMPAVRRQRPARNGRLRPLPRLSVVPPPLPVDRVRRPPLRSGAHEAVASGGELHRRELVRPSSSSPFPVPLPGLVRPLAPSLPYTPPPAPRAPLDR